MKLEFPIYPYICMCGRQLCSSCEHNIFPRRSVRKLYYVNCCSFFFWGHLLPCLWEDSALFRHISCPLHWHVSPALFIGTYLLLSSAAHIPCPLHWHISPDTGYIYKVQLKTLLLLDTCFLPMGGCRCIQLIMHYYGNHSHNTG